MKISLNSGGRRRRSKRALDHQELGTIRTLRATLTFSLLGLFVVNVLSVLSIIFFVGFGKMTLSEKLILTLVAETVAQAAAFFHIITKFLFSK